VPPLPRAIPSVMILLGIDCPVLPLKPIFDTNVFGDIQDRLISESDWRFLLRRRPGHGWPLSAVTAMELLAGVHDVPLEKVRGQIELACKLSKVRVLEEPRFLLCKEVLRVPFPPELVPLRPAVLAKYMEVVRLAKSREEILKDRVPFKRLLTRGKGRAGFKSSVLKDLVAGPKREWLERSEIFADEIYPRWREDFQATGKRLPDEMRKGLESRQVWDAERVKFGEGILRWLGASTEPESVAEITKRLDAVLEFTISSSASSSWATTISRNTSRTCTTSSSSTIWL
jgi:hypothetical protein